MYHSKSGRHTCNRLAIPMAVHLTTACHWSASMQHTFTWYAAMQVKRPYFLASRPKWQRYLGPGLPDPLFTCLWQ